MKGLANSLDWMSKGDDRGIGRGRPMAGKCATSGDPNTTEALVKLVKRLSKGGAGLIILL